MSLASLSEHAKVNCTLAEFAHLSFLCCLDAGGDWHKEWCKFTRDKAARLVSWSKCLGAAAWDDDELADRLAETKGLGCFPAPGSTTMDQDIVTFLVYLVLVPTGIIAILVVLALCECN